jgi:patatin-like phospholipase/acyl hydrolase
MGCGVISKVNESHQTATLENQRANRMKMKTTTKLNSIFIKDQDNDSMFARNSMHYFDIEKISNSLHNSTTNSCQKAIMYVMKGDQIFMNANSLNNKSSASIYKRALVYYTNANKHDKCNMESVMGIAKCLVKLNHFKKAIEYLDEMSKKMDLSKIAEYWHMQGICNRKIARIWRFKPEDLTETHLNKAHAACKHALKLSKNKEIIIKEKEIVERLINMERTYKNEISDYVKYMKENTSKYDLRTTRNNSEREFYKILSIDGNGVKGILPIFVLADIEKQCNRYLPDVFNMFAGTSTGGVIASMTTIPENERSTKPLYSASAQIEIFIDNGKNIFPRLNSMSRYLGQTLSCSKNLREMYRNKTKDFYLSQTLNDLIVSSMNCEGDPHTEYFTNYEARGLRTRDVPLADVLMATSTQPTYFEPYKIKGLGSFLDGSLTTKNSSRKAFEEAINRFKKNKTEIFVLSLSTDDSTASFSPNITFENLSRKSQWAAKSTIKDQFQETDVFMMHNLGKSYTHWEMSLDNQIQCDTYDCIPQLLEAGTQFVEEKQDQINRIVELLLEN